MKISFTRNHLYMLIIVIACIVVFINILPNEFVVDDVDFIVNWKETRSLSNTPDFFKGAVPEGHQGVYRPVRTIFYAFSYKLFGTNPLGYHIQSILVHIICTLLIYLIITHITKKSIIAFMSSLIFAVHPVHVEAVTFITTSFDIIGVIFFLLSFYLYIKAKKNKNFYYLSILFALLAFFTYEFTIVLPVLIVLYEFCFNKLRPSNIKVKAVKYSPYFIGVFFYLFIRIFVLKIVGRGTYLAGSFFHTMLTMTKAFVRYIQLMFLPINLTFIHFLPGGISSFAYPDNSGEAVLSQSLFDPMILFSLAIIILTLYLAYKSLKHHPVISFSILWFYIGLAPVSYIIPQAAILSEKYLYISSIGYSLLFGYLLDIIYNKLNKKTHTQTVIAIIFIAFTLFYSYSTIDRNTVWKDEQSLWTNTIKVSPLSAVANDNIGQIYYQQGNIELAEQYYGNAINLSPEFAFPYNNLGQIYYDRGNITLAHKYFKKASEINPLLPFAHLNLGKTYNDLGEYDLAIIEFKKTIVLKPENSDAYYNLGLAYHMSENLDQAISNYQKSIQLNSSFADAIYNLAFAYQQKGDYSLALDNYARYLEYDVNDPSAYYNIGLIYNQNDDHAKAVKAYEIALKINPDHINANLKLGLTYHALNQTDLAIVHYQDVLKLDPENEIASAMLDELQ